MPFIQSFEELLDEISSRGIKIPPMVASSSHISHSFLLRGIERGWWTGMGASTNPNLQWSWIEEHLNIAGALDLEAVLSYNETISWPQLERLMSISDAPEFASNNETMPLGYVLSHPKVKWDISLIAERRDYDIWMENLLAEKLRLPYSVPSPSRVTYDMLRWDDFDPEAVLDIEPGFFSRSASIRVDFIIDSIVDGFREDIWDIKELCRHPCLTKKMIEKEKRIDWGWYPLLCLDMEKEALISLFEKYRDDPEAAAAFWSHPEVTLDMIDTVEPLSIKGLSRNPNLTWDFIIDNLDMMSNSDESFERMLRRSNWSESERTARKRDETAAAIQRWYRRVTIYDISFPRAKKRAHESLLLLLS